MFRYEVEWIHLNGLGMSNMFKDLRDAKARYDELCFLPSRYHLRLIVHRPDGVTRIILES